MRTRFFRRAGTSGVRAHGRKKGRHAGSSGVRKAFAACRTQSSDGMRRTKMPESRIFTAAIQASRSDGCRYAPALSTKSGRKTEIRKTPGKQTRTHRRLSETAPEKPGHRQSRPSTKARRRASGHRLAIPVSPSPSDGRRPATKQSPAGKAPQSAARDGGEPQTVFARNTFAYGHLVRNGDNPRDSPKLPGGSIVRRSRRKPGTGPGRPTAKPSVCQGIVLHGERHDASGRGICRHTAGADRTPAIRPSRAFPAPRRNSRRNFLSLHK